MSSEGESEGEGEEVEEAEGRRRRRSFKRFGCKSFLQGEPNSLLRV
jgi:hypothetical protein